MKSKQAKRERQGEQLGRGLGLVGPWKYARPDAWLYRWEDRADADLRYGWEVARERPNAKPPWEDVNEGWPFSVCSPKRILGEIGWWEELDPIFSLVRNARRA